MWAGEIGIARLGREKWILERKGTREEERKGAGFTVIQKAEVTHG